jgi:hypothetical protein
MTVKVEIFGWQNYRDQKRISLVDAIRLHTGVGLAAGKRLLDEFTENGRVVLTLRDLQRAQAFVDDLSNVGASARVLEGPSSDRSDEDKP